MTILSFLTRVMKGVLILSLAETLLEKSTKMEGLT